jgi:hypothetical protein
MNEKLKDKTHSSQSREVLDTLRRIEKHLQDLVYYTTPERAFLSSAGRADISTDMSDNTIKELVTQEVKRYLKEKK